MIDPSAPSWQLAKMGARRLVFEEAAIFDRRKTRFLEVSPIQAAKFPLPYRSKVPNRSRKRLPPYRSRMANTISPRTQTRSLPCRAFNHRPATVCNRQRKMVLSEVVSPTNLTRPRPRLQHQPPVPLMDQCLTHSRSVTQSQDIRAAWQALRTTMEMKHKRQALCSPPPGQMAPALHSHVQFPPSMPSLIKKL